jgi:hypothetical protein
LPCYSCCCCCHCYCHCCCHCCFQIEREIAPDLQQFKMGLCHIFSELQRACQPSKDFVPALLCPVALGATVCSLAALFDTTYTTTITITTGKQSPPVCLGCCCSSTHISITHNQRGEEFWQNPARKNPGLCQHPSADTLTSFILYGVSAKDTR